jgi:hypothetical protein
VLLTGAGFLSLNFPCRAFDVNTFGVVNRGIVVHVLVGTVVSTNLFATWISRFVYFSSRRCRVVFCSLYQGLITSYIHFLP